LNLSLHTHKPGVTSHQSHPQTAHSHPFKQPTHRGGGARTKVWINSWGGAAARNQRS